MKDHLTAEEAAKELGYHIGHLYRLLRAGTIKGEKLSNKVWLIAREEVGRVKAEQDIYGKYHPNAIII